MCVRARAHMFGQIGSPTALADESLLEHVRRACVEHHRTAYVAAGAFWGFEDVKKMADLGILTVRVRASPTNNVSTGFDGVHAQTSGQFQIGIAVERIKRQGYN